MSTRHSYLLALSFTLPLASCHFVGLRPDFSVMGDAFTPVEHDSVYVESKPGGATHLAVYQPAAPTATATTAQTPVAAPAPPPVAATPPPAPRPAPAATPATESKSVWASIGDFFSWGEKDATQSVAQAQPAPKPQAAVAARPQQAPYAQNQPESAAVIRVYTVQPGDSLSRIAKLCKVPLGSLAAANGIDLQKPLIHPGQKLRVPQGGAAIIAPPASAVKPVAPAAAKPVAPATRPAPVQAATKPALPPAPKGKYRVCAGDTLYRIARRHGISLQELLRANNLDEQGARSVRIGTLLTIPTQP